MAYEIVRAAEVTRDLELIFDFLVTVADELGESPNRAFARAEKRLAEIEAAMADLGRLPHRDTRRQIRILAVFFGDQDHEAHILLRLLGDS